MIVTRRDPDTVLGPRPCTFCEESTGYIFIWGFAENQADMVLCYECALRLKRILIEDLLELSSGYRNGVTPKIERVKGMSWSTK